MKVVRLELGKRRKILFLRMATPAVEPKTSLNDLPSPDAIRARFPALARQHAGKPVAYFDGPGGTQVPHDVVNAMTDYLLRRINAQAH
jgi:selenocysteine lyase/cysteine desulfurase